MKALAPVALFIFVAGLSALHSSWLWAFVSLGLFLLLCATGFPLAKILFTDRVDIWILALPMGFAFHSLMLSIAGAVLGIHRWTLLAYLTAAVLLASWSYLRSLQGQGSTWTKEDAATLYVWLFMTLVVVAVPFARVGQETADGFAYRAYFNADFFRNLAVSASLSHSNIPPDNPYMAGQALHYYWFFHLMPAFWSKLLPGFRADSLMVQFSLVSLLMFVAVLVVTLRRFVTSRKTTLMILPVFLFGGSYEGLYVWHYLRQRQLPWTEFVNVNVDGILRWSWKAPQIDALYRALLYAPQHLIALSIFLIALLFWKNGDTEKRRSIAAQILFYGLIFSALGFSAFVGVALILGAAVLLGLRLLRAPRENWKEALSATVLGIGFLGLYLSFFQMFQAGGAQWDFGIDRIILAHLPSYLVLNWGALLPLGVAGILFGASKVPRGILGMYLCLCFFSILFLRLMLAGFSDVSLKLGHFSHVLLLFFAAAFIDRFIRGGPDRTKIMAMILIVLLVPSFLTWSMDAFNAADIRNRRFTSYLNKNDAEVFRWMNKKLPQNAAVFNFSPEYNEFIQDLIPPFAERPVYIGNRIFSRIFQVSEDQVQQRVGLASKILSSRSPDEMRQMLNGAGVDYVFVSSAGVAKLPAAAGFLTPPHFALLIQEGETRLYRVNRPK